MDLDEPKHWRLMFRVEPAQLFRALFASTPPDTLLRISDGLPADARFVRMHVDQMTQSLYALYEHESFEAKYQEQGLNFCCDTCLVIERTPHLTAFSGEAVRAVIEGA